MWVGDSRGLHSKIMRFHGERPGWKTPIFTTEKISQNKKVMNGRPRTSFHSNRHFESSLNRPNRHGNSIQCSSAYFQITLLHWGCWNNGGKLKEVGLGGLVREKYLDFAGQIFTAIGWTGSFISHLTLRSSLHQNDTKLFNFNCFEKGDTTCGTYCFQFLQRQLIFVDTSWWPFYGSILPQWTWMYVANWNVNDDT